METSPQTKQTWWSIIVGFALLAIFVWLFYVGVRALFMWLGGIQSPVAIAIIAGSLAATASIVSLTISKHLEARAAIRQEHRARKSPVYEELIGLFFRVLYAEKLGQQPPTEQELVQAFVPLTQKLMVWASDDVIKAYAAFRRAGLGQPKPSPLDIMRVQEDLFLAIRRDLGHDSRKLPRGTLLRLFIND
jgi:hypothetical protein